MTKLMVQIAAMLLFIPASVPAENQEEMIREVYQYLAQPEGAGFADFRKLSLERPQETKKAWKMVRSLCSATLGRLGYGTGPFNWAYGGAEERALLRFQEDLNIPITGVLDSLTIHHLREAATALDKARPTLPPKRFQDMDGFIQAEGVWLAPEADLAYPTNGVKLECIRATKICHVFSVEFEPRDNGQIYLNHDIYEVTEWTPEHVLAERRGRLLTIARRSESITLARSGMEAHPDKLFDGYELSFSEPTGEGANTYRNVYGAKDRYRALLEKNTLGLKERR